MSIVPHPLYGVHHGGAMAHAHPAPEDSALVPVMPPVPPEVSMNLLNTLLIFYQVRVAYSQYC